MDTLMEEMAGAAGGGSAVPAPLGADDLLVLPMPKRMVVQYAINDAGARELRLFHGDKEVSFDEPELFAFGETLARQSRFRAGAATGWGGGYEWDQIRELFEQLIEEGVLVRADEQPEPAAPAVGRARPSPLPPAACAAPRTWAEAEAITRELTGRAVEPGHLELFIPIFRVAHPALDADGRQVGEANVFPRALRLDVPTEWSACPYRGTRHMAEQPMNLSALKAMCEHWRQMMAALHRIRAAYLRRFPEAAEGWTVGHVERLATSVLAVPTYQLMRGDRPVANGDLHPALSSMFRVTDGLRMVMHQMLFVPIGEPTRSTDDPVTADQILDYAERNYSFVSGTGVCAGPQNMVRDFLGALLEGTKEADAASFAFDPPVEAALGDVDAAIDYALLGLQAFATTFSMWPLMTRTYERLAEIAVAAVEGGADGFVAFRDRMVAHRQNVKESPFLATEVWRADREHVYADMYDGCGRGLAAHRPPAKLRELIAPAPSPDQAALEARLREMLRRRLRVAAADEEHLERLLFCLVDYALRTQAILREATATQACINRLLGRTPPARPFGAAEMDVHYLLQGAEGRRLPYLLNELAVALGVRFEIDPRRIAVTEADAELAA